MEVAARERAKTFARFRPGDARIVLLNITDDTLKRLRVMGDKVPRAVHGELINRLRKAGARVIAFDLLFIYHDADDAKLRSALIQPGKLKVALGTNFKREKRVSESDFDYEFNDLPVAPAGLSPNVTVGHVTATRSGVYVVSAVLLERDPTRPRLFPHLALVAALQYLGIPPDSARLDPERNTVEAGGVSWDLEGNADLSVQWQDRPDAFPVVEYSNALEDLRRPGGGEGFRDKIVVVGDTRSGSPDVVVTVPFGSIPGVFVIANLINTLLMNVDQRYSALPAVWHWVWCLLLASLTAIAVVSGKRYWAVVALCFMCALGILVPMMVAQSRIDVETVAPVLGVIIAFLVAGVFELGLAIPLDMRASGQEEEATVMFVDLRDSTGITHRLGGAAYQRIFSDFSSKAKKEVDKQGGIIERTTGDGFLIVFRGANHAQRCVRCVQPILEVVASVGQVARVGIESGTVSGGFVWEGARRVWSSAGDPVNLAARLQSACENAGVSALLGPVAASLLVGTTSLGEPINLSLRGFDNQIRAFPIIMEGRREIQNENRHSN
jgi:CHASE2 domain-containing sensor protein/class 3 adenylate cyclase